MINFRQIISGNRGTCLSAYKTESCSVLDQQIWHVKKPRLTNKSWVSAKLRRWGLVLLGEFESNGRAFFCKVLVCWTLLAEVGCLVPIRLTGGSWLQALAHARCREACRLSRLLCLSGPWGQAFRKYICFGAMEYDQCNWFLVSIRWLFIVLHRASRCSIAFHCVCNFLVFWVFYKSLLMIVRQIFKSWISNLPY